MSKGDLLEMEGVIQDALGGGQYNIKVDQGGAIVRAPRIMSKYYRAILDLLLARGFAAPRQPVRVTKLTKLAIIFRYAFI